MTKAPAAPQEEFSLIQPDPRTLTTLAAGIMETAWFRDRLAEEPKSMYGGAHHRVAVQQALDLFDECAVAIGLKDNPRNLLTTKYLWSRFLLSGARDCYPIEMIKGLAVLSVQMLSAGTPRGKAVDEALGLLATSEAQLSIRPDSAAPIPQPPRWPGRLKDFYRLILKVRNKEDAQPRFRRYLGHRYLLMRFSPHWSQQKEDQKIAGDFDELHTNGFDKTDWLIHARAYRRWWSNEKHLTKQRAGRAGYEAKMRTRVAPQKSSKAS